MVTGGKVNAHVGKLNENIKFNFFIPIRQIVNFPFLSFTLITRAMKVFFNQASSHLKSKMLPPMKF